MAPDHAPVSNAGSVETTRIPRDRGHYASVALAAVLVLLSATALLGAYTSYRAGTATQHATRMRDAFEDARYAVASEESLERKYRLEPSEAVRARHAAAAQALVAALDQARALGADEAAINDLIARHTIYLSAIARMFAAVDAHDTALVNRIDAEEADPIFDAIEAEIAAESEAHRDDSKRHLQALTDIQRQVVIATPIVFAFGMVLTIFLWSMIRRLRRQADEGRARETAAIRRSEQRFRSLIQNTSDVVLICSATGGVTYQSPSVETSWGYEGRGLLDRRLQTLVHPDDQAPLQALWAHLKDRPDSTRSIEVQIRRADGTWRQIDLILSNLLHVPNVAGLVATARDITDRKAFEKQLERQAFYDSLTGLPNRVLLRDRLDQVLTRTGQHHGNIGLLFLDLDNFKHINDSFGHQTGDILLAEVATRLQACVEENNTVARLGGDEFVILLESVASEADALLLADRIEQDLRQPFVLDGRECIITASIGIVLGEATEIQADSFLRDADTALYRAKSNGKAHSVIFDAAMRIDALAQLQLENDLRAAIRQDELRVYYQPTIALEAGRIAGMEALLRWQHPTRGLILPAEFIPIAEETGLIVPIGQWALEQACKQVAAWHKAYPTNPPVSISVNLSPRQFQQPNLFGKVEQVLRESGLPSGCLILEITEGVIMRDVEATIPIIRQLKEIGVRLAVDDFGTGYSSLTYLKRLPLDVLKIDRSFVNGIGQTQEDTAIVRAIISLAKSLNLSITAEGIETTEQAALLRKWACDRGQGYFFARPLDAEGMGDLLASAQSRTPTIQSAV